MNSEDCHGPALNNMFQLYSLARESVKMVSAKEPIKIPPVSLRSDSKGKDSEGQESRGWKHVTANLDSVGSGTAVILLLHGCDGMTTDIWSWRRLKDHYQSLSIYLIIKESDKKLLDHIDAGLRKPIISHWREARGRQKYWHPSQVAANYYYAIP